METTSITLWLEKLAGGDQDATRRIWEQYYERLLHVARHRLGRSPRRVADEEDVVLSAFNSFCAGVAAGRFPHLRDRDDLWRLLLTITARKAVSLLRWQHCRRRGGRAVRGDSAFGKQASDRTAGIDEVLGGEPTPELAAVMTEEFGRLIDLLDDASLRLIAVLKLEAYTNEEIARSLDCCVATVERKLARIRKTWSTGP